MIENALKKSIETNEKNTATTEKNTATTEKNTAGTEKNTATIEKLLVTIEKLLVAVEANTNITTRLNHKIVEPVKKEMEEAKAEKEAVEKETPKKEAVEKETPKKEAVEEVVKQPIQEVMEEVEKAVNINVTVKLVREIANKAMAEGVCTRDDIVKEIETYCAKKLDDLDQDGLNGLYAYLMSFEKTEIL